MLRAYYQEHSRAISRGRKYTGWPTHRWPCFTSVIAPTRKRFVCLLFGKGSFASGFCRQDCLCLGPITHVERVGFGTFREVCVCVCDSQAETGTRTHTHIYTLQNCLLFACGLGERAPACESLDCQKSGPTIISVGRICSFKVTALSRLAVECLAGAPSRACACANTFAHVMRTFCYLL